MKRILSMLALLLAGAAVLALLRPGSRGGAVAYDYAEGAPWRYAPLIAPFQFPIVKGDGQLEAERDSVARGFLPYMNRADEGAEDGLARLRADFGQGRLPGTTQAAVDYAAGRMAELYGRGIIAPEVLEDLRQRGASGVRVISGRDAQAVPIDGLLTTRAAYDLLMDADSVGLPREELTGLRVNDYLVPNLVPDTAKSAEELRSELARIIPNIGVVEQGERIIDRGEIVSPAQRLRLDSYAKAAAGRKDAAGDRWQRLGGNALLALLLLALFPIYLLMFRRDYLRDGHAVGLFFSLIILFPLAAYLLVRAAHTESVFLVPFAMLPLFVRIFFDSRTATMALLLMLLLASLGLQAPFEFFLVEVFMGLAAVYGLKELTDRAQLFRIALIVTAAGLLMQFALDMSQGYALRELSASRYAYIVMSGVLLLFAYALMYVVERVFGFTSSVTLVELSNINNPLMRKLSKVAQGTFNHSMQVANLAAEVADKIGAKPQLVRTGALYHDIGKMLNPAFFTENQSGVNPHDELREKDGLSPEEQSAKIIIDHVTEGLKLAEKYHLPKELRDFIVTHHGRSQVKYFFVQWQNNHPGEQPDEANFTYPGPNPFTKEQAILMMCDAVEASSRSLKEYTEESITGLVERIVDGQSAAGCFRDCPITFRDMQDAKRVLIESLKTIYHTRIAYPELNTGHPEPAQQHRISLLGGRFHRGGRDYRRNANGNRPS
ncbi:MAG: HDIG domain-containing protein [Alloprevotella sp.]|nr:HDIG domain-containing protein [Alloprevotella sp.]